MVDSEMRMSSFQWLTVSNAFQVSSATIMVLSGRWAFIPCGFVWTPADELLVEPKRLSFVREKRATECVSSIFESPWCKQLVYFEDIEPGNSFACVIVRGRWYVTKQVKLSFEVSQLAFSWPEMQSSSKLASKWFKKPPQLAFLCGFYVGYPWLVHEHGQGGAQW